MNNLASTLQWLICIVGICCSIAVSAAPYGMWRWVNEEGIPQYSDIKPEGVDAVFIKMSRGKSSATPEPDTDQGTAKPSDKLNGTKLQMEVVKEPEKDPKICAQAQGNLKALSGTPKVRITEPDGSNRMLTPEEIEEQREVARGHIQTYCP